MKSRYSNLKPQVIALRKEGKSYGEMCKILNTPIPQSTLSSWCSSIPLTNEQQKRISDSMRRGATKGRATAWEMNKARREKYIESVRERVKYLSVHLTHRDTAKIALAMLYLGEGAKKSGSILFGNSNPLVVSLFLNLLRKCYRIDERKFRCTVQCRADQDIEHLEKFWAKVTKIPRSQFYKARVDPRTIGVVSKKKDYKGVCRIDYFSGDIFVEIMQIIDLTYKGH